MKLKLLAETVLICSYAHFRDRAILPSYLKQVRHVVKFPQFLGAEPNIFRQADGFEPKFSGGAIP